MQISTHSMWGRHAGVRQLPARYASYLGQGEAVPQVAEVSQCCARCAGVSDNRLQNVVITLDKVKLCMQQGQCRDPPLRVLSDAEVVEHLWSGARAAHLEQLPLRCSARV